MSPSRSEPLNSGNEELPIDARPCTTLCGTGRTDYSSNPDGRAPISTPSPIPRKVRPPRHQSKAFPGKFRRPEMYIWPRSAKKRRPIPSNATPHGSRLESCISNFDRKGGAASLYQGPGYAGSCSAEGLDEGGVRGVIRGGTTSVPGVIPLVETREEAPDGLMHGGLLWRESGFGREMEITTDRVPQEMVEACRPVSECVSEAT